VGSKETFPVISAQDTRPLLGRNVVVAHASSSKGLADFVSAKPASKFKSRVLGNRAHGCCLTALYRPSVSQERGLSHRLKNEKFRALVLGC
jgi:hypothetical protein